MARFPIHGMRFHAGKFYAQLDVGFVPGVGHYRPEVEVTQEQFTTFRHYGSDNPAAIKELEYPEEKIAEFEKESGRLVRNLPKQVARDGDGHRTAEEE